MATRESLGTMSFRISSCLPLISGAKFDNPVMFPPGRARLATKPDPTGSPSLPMTMGIVTVASLAERVAAGPAVTITSTLERASSAARLVTSFDLPSPNRYSITIFFPSKYPSSRSPSGMPLRGPRQQKRRPCLGKQPGEISLAAAHGREGGAQRTKRRLELRI